MSFNNRGNIKWRAPLILISLGILLFGLAILGGSAYTPIKYGTVGLVTRFGGLTGTIFEPGLHWKLPLAEGIVSIPTVVLSYETSDNPELSNADYRDYPVNAQTVDGQQITIKYTVLFFIPGENAAQVVQNIGRPDEVVENVVKAHSRNLTRLRAQNYSAEELYSGEGIFNYEQVVRDGLAEEFGDYGITLDKFLVRKVEFDADYITAIEEQQIAQESIETAQYKSEAAEYEKERQIRLAEADAERTKLMAQADAERERLLADAEAYSIEQRGAALEGYPQLIQWQFVRSLENVQWGVLPGEGIQPLMPIPSFGEGDSGEATMELPTPMPTPIPEPSDQ